MAEITAQEAIEWIKEHAHHLAQVKRGGSALDLGEIAALIEQQQQQIERLNKAEKVAKAAQFYLNHINSPLCIGWDDLLDALSDWKQGKESAK